MYISRFLLAETVIHTRHLDHVSLENAKVLR